MVFSGQRSVRRHPRISNAFAFATFWLAFLVFAAPAYASPLHGLEMLARNSVWMAIDNCEGDCSFEALRVTGTPSPPSNRGSGAERCIGDVIGTKVTDASGSGYYGLFLFARADWTYKGEVFGRRYRLFVSIDPDQTILCVPETIQYEAIHYNLAPDLTNSFGNKSVRLADQEALQNPVTAVSGQEVEWTAAYERFLSGRETSWSLTRLFSSKLDQTVRVRFESLPEGAAINVRSTGQKFTTNRDMAINLSMIERTTIQLDAKILPINSCKRQKGRGSIDFTILCDFTTSKQGR